MSDTPENTLERHRFKLDQFEGPLDLLLFLIKKNDVNIYDIPIGEITQQYLDFLKLATKVELEDLTDFYHLAATLIYIKSKMLLPIEMDLDEELEDPRSELVAKLIEYQKFKKLTALMAEKTDQDAWFLSRKKKQPVLPFAEEDHLWEKVEVWDLLKTFSGLITDLSPEKIFNLYEEVSVNEKVSLVNELLERQDEFSFQDLITKPDSILDIVCAFLAILELVKSRKISILQSRLYGDIKIIKKQENEDDFG